MVAKVVDHANAWLKPSAILAYSGSPNTNAPLSAAIFPFSRDNDEEALQDDQSDAVTSIRGDCAEELFRRVGKAVRSALDRQDP
jgi:hypothetical protein